MPWLSEKSDGSSLSQLAGELSYPLFLTHSFIIYIFVEYFDMRFNSWSFVAVVSLFTLLLSFAMVILVDRPISVVRTNIRNGARTAALPSGVYVIMRVFTFNERLLQIPTGRHYISMHSNAMMRMQDGTNSKQRIESRLLAVIVSVIFAMGIGEAALRFAYPDGLNVGKIFKPWNFLQFDPVLGWRNIANFNEGTFKINSAHYRGRELSPLLEEGAIRVMCLGDSRTFGVWGKERGIYYDNDYASVLERLISESTSPG